MSGIGFRHESQRFAIKNRKASEKGIDCLLEYLWRGYPGIAAKGYVYRMVAHGKQKYSLTSTHGEHINSLEGSWEYLKRKLAAKGEIRKERLHLYLGEYVWRYNYRR